MAEMSLQCVGGSYDPMQNFPRGESDVSIECVQSSEFVVGKQANFNGAVTIINCADAPMREGDEEGKSAGREEKVIIRNKVLAPEEPPQGVPDRTRKLADMRQKLEKWGIWNKKSLILAASAFICIGLLATAAVVLVGLFPTESAAGKGNASHPFYSKEDWQGKPPKSIVKMKLPVPYVVVSHTVTPLCYTLKGCTPLIQNMQDYHQGIEFADISYNFLIDSGGNIYEGRGWDRRNVQSGFVNSRNIDVGLIGDYSESIEPTEELMDGLKYLLDFGLAHGKISENYSLVASNATYSTLSPGKNVYNVIKDWPHFDANPKEHIKEFEE